MMKQITLIVGNRVGALADVTEILGKNGINIASISAQGFGEKGLIRFITTDVNSAVNHLRKAGFDPIVNDVIILKLLDKPGELFKVTKKLSRKGVNLHSVYILGREGNRTEIVIEPEDYQKALKALSK
ncbi:MAG: ACT domain-containing protein [Candidatus Asgardarchaeia archaeon]